MNIPFPARSWLPPVALAGLLALPAPSLLAQAEGEPSPGEAEAELEEVELESDEGPRSLDGASGLSFFDTGPLRIREQFLLGMGFLALEPVAADILPRGRWQLDFIQSATNTWVKSDSVEDVLEARERRDRLGLEELREIEGNGSRRGIYFADGEVYRTTIGLRVGLGAGLLLGVSVPVLSFDGGFADSLIEEFHDTTGFSQSGRLGVPRDAYTVYLRDPEGNEVFRSEEPGTGLGDVLLSLQRLLVKTAHHRLSLEGVAKLATGDEEDLYSTGSEDYGAQLLYARYFFRSCFHVNLGVIRLGDAPLFHLDEQTRLSGLVGWEQAIGRSASVITQVTIAQSPFEDLDIEGLDEISYLADIGFKKGIGEHSVVFLALSENFLTFGSSADVGLHLGVTHIF